MSNEGTPERWSRGHDVALVAGVAVAAELVLPGSSGAVTPVLAAVLERRQQRVQDLSTQVLREVTPTELTDRLDADERFGELSLRAIARVADASWEPKRKAMGRVVLQALKGDDAAMDDSERLLTALGALQAADFAVLARLSAETATRAEDGSNIGIGAKDIPGLAECGGALLRYGVAMQDPAIGGLTYESTAMGEKLLALVSMPGPTERPS